MPIFNLAYGGNNTPTPITTAGIYHNSDLGLISLSSDGSNWLTISDKNLGATTVRNDGDALSETNCGKLYQWGNNYGFPYTGATTKSSSTVNAQNYGPGNYYSSSTFITGSFWDSGFNANLWGGTTGTNSAKQGPCPSGFHIPSISEGSTIRSIIVSQLGIANANQHKLLKMPYGVRLSGDNGKAYNNSTYEIYWSADQYSSTYGKFINISNNNGIAVSGNNNKTRGYAIRPFSDTSVQPDTSRTKLY